eukprot:scaffold4.g4862.t1
MQLACITFLLLLGGAHAAALKYTKPAGSWRTWVSDAAADNSTISALASCTDQLRAAGSFSFLQFVKQVAGSPSAPAAPLSRDAALALSCVLDPLLRNASQPTAAALLGAYFNAWAAAHGRKYKGAEADARFATFKANLADIVAINQAKLPYWAAPNQFADQSFAEFKNTTLMRGQPFPTDTDIPAWPYARRRAAARKLQQYTMYHDDLPQVVDWVAAGKVTPVESQAADCGAGWAYAATAAVESRLLILSGRNASAAAACSPLDLSEQQLLDCVAPAAGYASYGCAYGQTTDAFRYARNASGLALESQYPNAASAAPAPCDAKALARAAAAGEAVRLSQDPGYRRVYPTVEGLVLEALGQQPLAAYLAVDASLVFYAGGIYTGAGPRSRCLAGGINTVVLLTGYNQSDKSASYVVAKNSWGTEWGVNGFAKLAMANRFISAGTCGVYQFVYAPTTANATLPASVARAMDANAAAGSKAAAPAAATAVAAAAKAKAAAVPDPGKSGKRALTTLPDGDTLFGEPRY